MDYTGDTVEIYSTEEISKLQKKKKDQRYYVGKQKNNKEYGHSQVRWNG